MLLIAKCVHRLPEAVVKEGVDLVARDECLDRLAFEHLRIIGHLLQHFG